MVMQCPELGEVNSFQTLMVRTKQMVVCVWVHLNLSIRTHEECT